MGPPISSLPFAATSSSLVGCTTGSGSCTLVGVVSALGMGHILPYQSENSARAKAVGRLSVSRETDVSRETARRSAAREAPHQQQRPVAGTHLMGTGHRPSSVR
ncbi:hypothetical protein GCM10010321_72160 [Streptomyces chartreusis]|nr:hypothetical protein GCM10010321_72160 [Streptomyces chartreusis]